MYDTCSSQVNFQECTSTADTLRIYTDLPRYAIINGCNGRHGFVRCRKPRGRGAVVLILDPDIGVFPPADIFKTRTPQRPTCEKRWVLVQVHLSWYIYLYAHYQVSWRRICTQIALTLRAKLNIVRLLGPKINIKIPQHRNSPITTTTRRSEESRLRQAVAAPTIG